MSNTSHDVLQKKKNICIFVNIHGNHHDWLSPRMEFHKLDLVALHFYVSRSTSVQNSVLTLLTDHGMLG
ncbi:hypothetical protein MTR67_030612 [Solanum verrucosum]|uniref:Uncharacterized protein n=1 Tax=Solanum verrucosum TaxID=315347 RepID=A0AAF0R6B1_SOLVR|nr:hypothetical protein MTR67_030612 [Solanum verrucosum]